MQKLKLKIVNTLIPIIFVVMLITISIIPLRIYTQSSTITSLAKSCIKVGNLTIISLVNSVAYITQYSSVIASIPGISAYWSNVTDSTLLLTVGSYLKHPAFTILNLSNSVAKITYISNLRGSLYDCVMLRSKKLICIGYIEFNETYSGLIVHAKLLKGSKDVINISKVRVLICGHACYLRRILSLGSSYLLVGGYAYGAYYTPLFLNYHLNNSNNYREYITANLFVPKTGLLANYPCIGLVSDAELISNYLIVSVRSNDGLSIHFINMNNYLDRCYFSRELSGISDSTVLAVASKGLVIQVYELVSTVTGKTCLLSIDLEGGGGYLCGIHGVQVDVSKGVVKVINIKGINTVYPSLLTELSVDSCDLSRTKALMRIMPYRVTTSTLEVKAVLIRYNLAGTSIKRSITQNFTEITEISYTSLSTEPQFIRVRKELPNIAYLVIGCTLLTTYLIIRLKLLRR